MAFYIANALCSWGADDPTNPWLPPYQKVLTKATQAGYRSIELGPWGYLSTDPDELTRQLNTHQLSLVAGTIFDDLVSEVHFPTLVTLIHNLCRNLARAPVATATYGTNALAPYLVIIDFGNPHRAKYAGQSDNAPRLSDQAWQRMMQHITTLSQIAWQEYCVRPVIHPHAGGCIEFADELARLVSDIPHPVAGLCLDTGHLYYAGMDPVEALQRYWTRIDYLHFKDVNQQIWRNAIARGLDFFSVCAEGVMCPLGQGAIDYPAVRALLTERDYQGWITIEQEHDPRHDDTSLHYLRSTRF